MKIRAAVAFAAGQDLQVEDVDLQCPKAGEALVEIKATGVCHTDAFTLSGDDLEGDFPAILGHEGAGILVDVGPGVISVKPGDHVIPLYTPKCRQCKFCLYPKTSLCQSIRETQGQGLMPDGSRRSSLDGQLILHYIGCGVITGMGAVAFAAKVEPDSNVVVFTLGGGLNVIQGAKLVGTNKIIGIDMNPEKARLAAQFGMTNFINLSEVENVVEHIIQLTDGGADYSFDCIGNVNTMRQTIECCHKGWGESFIIRVAGAGQEISTPPFQLATGRSWKGTAFGGARGRTHMPKIIDWYMDGKINIDDLITHTMPLDDVNKAFDLMHKGESIRSVILY